MKNIFYFALFLVFFLFEIEIAHAQVVATACIESVHDESIPSELTLYLENRLMDSFFNAGLIVTTFPYAKGKLKDYLEANLSTFSFENDIDYFILVYFLYEKNRKYDEFKRGNLLPCKELYCKVFEVNGNKLLYEEKFNLDDFKALGTYKKLDMCFLQLEQNIIKSIRGNL